jgi:hypothetical protein
VWTGVTRVTRPISEADCASQHFAAGYSSCGLRPSARPFGFEDAEERTFIQQQGSKALEPLLYRGDAQFDYLIIPFLHPSRGAVDKSQWCASQLLICLCVVGSETFSLVNRAEKALQWRNDLDLDHHTHTQPVSNDFGRVGSKWFGERFLKHKLGAKSFGSVPTAIGTVTRLACARLREAGLSPEPLLAQAGLTLEQIKDRRARISVERQIRLLNLAAGE